MILFLPTEIGQDALKRPHFQALIKENMNDLAEALLGLLKSVA